MAVSNARSPAKGTLQQPTLGMVCEEEKLSEKQQKVYVEWDKRVKEYDALMKKHKEEEEKYQKAIKAVDTRVGLKNSGHQTANGPTKFLRGVPSSSPQSSIQRNTVNTTSISNGVTQPRVQSSSVGFSGVALHRQSSDKNAAASVSSRQQLAYGGGQLAGRPKIGVTSSGVRMVVNTSTVPALPGVTRTSALVMQNGVGGITKRVLQPGVRMPTPQNTTLNAPSGVPNSTLQAGMKQLSPYANNTARSPAGMINVSKAVKRSSGGSSPQDSKRIKTNVDSKDLLKYYPMKRGIATPTEDTSRRFKIKCFHCNDTMASNVQYATHVKKIVEGLWPDNSNLNSIVVCPKCFKRFRTPYEMQEHLERSHVKGCIYQCFTCDLSFTNSSTLLIHMDTFHPVAQMPFVCQICKYRTSAYADIIEHFSLKHEGYKALMCPYCLKMLRCSKTFLQHCQKHIQSAMRLNHGTFPCKSCKLTFLSTAERIEHVDKDHKKFDIRYRDGVPRYVRDTLKSLEIMASAGISLTNPKPSTPKKLEIKYTFTQDASINKKLACMECGVLLSNFASHFTVMLYCDKCKYSSFCPRSISNHMILFHKSGREMPKVGIVRKKRNTDGTITLTCKSCNYQTKAPTHMAHHRAKKCAMRTPMEWISYLFVPGAKKPQTHPNKLVDVIVLDSDED